MQNMHTTIWKYLDAKKQIYMIHHHTYTCCYSPMYKIAADIYISNVHFPVAHNALLEDRTDT